MKPHLFLFLSLVTLTWAKTPLQIKMERGFPFHSEATETTASEAGGWTKARLPDGNVIPTRYVLRFIPILDPGIPGFPQFTVDGEATITVKAQIAGKRITLNSNGIDVTSDSITVTPVEQGDGDFVVTKSEAEPENEFYIIEVDKDFIPEHEYSIYMKFRSPISQNETHGIYLSRFPDPENNNEESLLAATQFAPTAAREAFPCFDEPQIKASFKISLAYNPKPEAETLYVALSNNEMESETDFTQFPVPGWKLRTFKETVPMSTYLVAILVAKYDYVEAEPEDGDDVFKKPARIYAPEDLVSKGGAYAANQSSRLLTFFQEYTGIEYHLDKIDSVVIPDFLFGAMENWGLNKYRPSLLLYFPEESTELSRSTVTEILAHELAHQWFGNLVTSEFWDQIWLNEGFATYFEYLGVEDVQPDFKPLELRQFKTFQLALEADSSAATHPVINSARVEGSTFDEFMRVFSTITYQKGGSLLRMMETFLTPATFQAGLKTYLNEKAFEGANQNDLFKYLNDQAVADGVSLPPEMTVKDIMDTWTLQSGFPLVRVTTGFDSNEIQISQERFTPDVIYTPGHGLDPNHLWTIPVAIATAQNPDFSQVQPKLWIEKDIAMRTHPENNTQWIVVNPDGVGFYRVLYDGPLFKLLLEELNSGATKISTLSRSQIIDDYFAFYIHGFAEIETALELTRYLNAERELVVWSTVLLHLTEFLNKLSGDNATYTEFKAYLNGKLGDVLQDTGFSQAPQDSGVLVLLRSQLLDWACTLHHEGCLLNASSSFDVWPIISIPVDIRPVVFCGAVAAGGTPDPFYNALEYYKDNSTSEMDKAFLLNALACTTAQENIQILLENLLQDNSEILEGDLGTLFTAIAANTHQGRSAAIAHLLANAEALITKLKPTSILSFFSTLSNFVLTSSEQDSLKEFITTNEAALESVKAGLEAHMSTVGVNTKWFEANNIRLQAWFEAANNA